MLLGTLALLLVRRFERLPGAIPEGDIVVLAEAGTPAIARLAAFVERADAHLRRWPVAGLLLLALAILIGGALMLQA
jgi:hypothetical protein